MTLALEWKSKYPLCAAKSPPSELSKSTVALYSITKFINAGRHDQTVEVYSAPANIGEKVEGELGDWRKGMQILGISTQMALVLPFEINTRKGESKDGKL